MCSITIVYLITHIPGLNQFATLLLHRKNLQNEIDKILIRTTNT